VVARIRLMDKDKGRRFVMSMNFRKAIIPTITTLGYSLNIHAQSMIEYNIPHELFSKYPELVQLVLENKGIGNCEKQHWFNLIPFMDEVKQNMFKGILTKAKTSPGSVSNKQFSCKFDNTEFLYRGKSYQVTQRMRDNDPDLIHLTLASPSIVSFNEKQYFLLLYDFMSKEQITRYTKILTNEIEALSKIEKKEALQDAAGLILLGIAAVGFFHALGKGTTENRVHQNSGNTNWSGSSSSHSNNIASRNSNSSSKRKGTTTSANTRNPQKTGGYTITENIRYSSGQSVVARGRCSDGTKFNVRYSPNTGTAYRYTIYSTSAASKEEVAKKFCRNH